MSTDITPDLANRVDGQELFQRTWKVTIQTTPSTEDSPDGKVHGSPGTALETTEHDVTFKVTKTLKTPAEPNKCSLTIFNLNQAQRDAIEALNPETKLVHVRDAKKIKAAARKAKDGIGLKIEAGYAGKNNLIWLGDMRHAESEYLAPNWVTKLESGDGEKAWVNARVNVSFGPGTPQRTALEACIKALGLGNGNVQDLINSHTGLTKQLYTHGTTMAGPVRDRISDICRSANPPIEWSIVDGAVMFVSMGKKIDSRAILLTSDTGMLGTPKVDIDGIITVKTIMLPDVRPGRIMVVRTANSVLPAKEDDDDGLDYPTTPHEGNYRIEHVEYHGQSDGKDWGLTLKGPRY